MNLQLLHNKKIGIWGFGVVGQSLVRFLHAQDITLQIFEKRTLTDSEKLELRNQNISFFDSNQNLEHFLQVNDIIIASPGIDVRPYKNYQHKFIAELDLFYAHFKKPIIAVTGTIGKTTVVHLIRALLQAKGKRVAFGGNVGIGMCDLLETQDVVDCAVLELSSFQLEAVQSFAPTVAVWTNLFPNHLDRHGTMQGYFAAKYTIMQHQQADGIALMPFECAQQLYAYGPADKKFNFFIAQQPTEEQLLRLRSHDSLFFIDAQNNVCLWQQGTTKHLISVDYFPNVSFIQNWFIAYATLYVYGIELHPQDFANIFLELPEHRLQKCATKKGIDFYNDSKSTVPEATQAAVAQLRNKPIVLLLGGISKGVDRTALIASLVGSVKTIICFGKEAEQLHAMCSAVHMEAFACTTLEQALDIAVRHAKPGDQILLSPAGASYDLFANYEERGKRFKELVDCL